MPTVETFNRELIKTCLKELELHYLQDSDGDFVVDFAKNPDRGDVEMRIIIMASGKEHEILQIAATIDRRIPAASLGQAIMVCNKWNEETRIPKAYVHKRDDGTGTIVLENQVDFEKGVHKELLQHIIGCTIATSAQFWKKAYQEHHL